jgi:uncharacterized protein (DUF2236 family)
MEYFSPPGSIARQVWGNSDTVMLVFSGASAEFAVNRAVDWLFFTGRLPADPAARFFSTVRFAQQIMFADAETATATIDRVRKIHAAVERQRGQRIPDWASRDVLYMLMDYSARAFEMLNRPLTPAEQAALYAVNLQLGSLMGVPELPPTYEAWANDRQLHLIRDLAYSDYSAQLYRQYRRVLGPLRYEMLRSVQAWLVPEHVRELLKLRKPPGSAHTVALYHKLDQLGLRPAIQRLLLPPRYLADVRKLDVVSSASI